MTLTVTSNLTKVILIISIISFSLVQAEMCQTVAVCTAPNLVQCIRCLAVTDIKPYKTPSLADT